MMQQFLQQDSRFKVDIYRTQNTWKGGKLLEQYPLNDGRHYQDLPEPKSDPNFSPNFSQYDVVISNFGWNAAPWPDKTKQEFEQFVRNGGGFVVVHAANNSFPQWPEYNQMIGLGGWGNRNEKDGPYLYFNKHQKLIQDNSPGQGGGHGQLHPFQIQNRKQSHPIMSTFPDSWLHTEDELYNRLRGPAQNLEVLASAFDDKKYNGFGRHEPVVMTINYHQGRVFHTTLGHGIAVYQDKHFISLLRRGTQWAATGLVSEKGDTGYAYPL
ncbi:ThuA domain-containing protein [Paraglaciecola arctica]|nr:ThuA domain-containing protein [Paraglaciecola arctica]